MPKIITIYWRDIPSQVTVQEGRKRAKKLLPARFQEAIDRAAMRAKKTDSDAYLDDWRRETKKSSGDDLEQLVEHSANQFELEYDHEKLEEIVRNKGNIPNKNNVVDIKYNEGA